MDGTGVGKLLTSLRMSGKIEIAIEMRKELTDEWKARGITKEKEYAILTNDMTRAWSGMSVQEYIRMKLEHPRVTRVLYKIHPRIYMIFTY